MFPGTFHSPFTRVHASTNSDGWGRGHEEAEAEHDTRRFKKEAFHGVLPSNCGIVAFALTRSRIHIPAAPCPGTPQAIR